MPNVDVVSLIQTVVSWGLVLGLLFGYFSSQTNFCTLGAISDVVNISNWGRMRAWIFAMGIAIFGTQIFAGLGGFDISQTLYTSTTVPWVAHLIGGLLFGIGMTLASGCGNKTLIRIGGGNLKAVVVFLVLAYTAQLTLHGILAPLRVELLQSSALTWHLHSSQTLAHMLTHYFSLPLAKIQIFLAIFLGGGLMLFSFSNKEFRSNRDNLMAGVVLGSIIVMGWYVTGYRGYAENPETLAVMSIGTNSGLAESFSFIAPSAYTLELLERWTDKSLGFTWGISCVIGVFLGALTYAIIHRTFRWESFVFPADMLRHFAGAILMGFGAVTALGCTIGQGISGISTLSLGSIIATLAIITGAVGAMRFEFWLMMRKAG